MKKILLSSLLLSSFILADKIAIPMSANLLSVENSGSLSAIDAYQDGIGIYTVEQIGSAIIDNSGMNSLVYKYGAEAKATGVNVKEYILSSGSAAEKILAGELGKFKPIAPGNGSICDDKNASTVNDKYVNGVCVGVIADGTICDDKNASTINDKYINGVCIGVIADGTICDDNNALTSSDKYIKGVCSGIDISGIYNDNGTIKCENATIGQEYNLNNVKYLVVDNILLKNNLNRVSSVCITHVTSLYGLFINNSTFNTNINHWDTSNVTDMGLMFNYAIAFNQPLNNWNTDKVTNMYAMFSVATVFNQSISNWNTSNVTNMGWMFNYAKAFNQPLSNFNTEKVTNMLSMFRVASSFNQYIKNWNVSKVTNSTDFRINSALTATNSPF